MLVLSNCMQLLVFVAKTNSSSCTCNYQFTTILISVSKLVEDYSVVEFIDQSCMLKDKAMGILFLQGGLLSIIKKEKTKLDMFLL